MLRSCFHFFHVALTNRVCCPEWVFWLSPSHFQSSRSVDLSLQALLSRNWEATYGVAPSVAFNRCRSLPGA
jgi:hypothetical protein